MKRWMLIAIMLLSVLVISGKAGALSGSGTSGDPYIITTCTELQSIPSLDTDTGTSDIDGYFDLGNDIDCSDTVNWNGGQGFEPIGTFEGVFDGKGFTVDAIYQSGQTYASVFEFLVDGGIIRNVGFTNRNATGDYVSGVVQTAWDSTIENVYVEGELNGDYVYGLVGFIENSTIQNSYVRANLTSLGTDAAGLIGDISGAWTMTDSSTIENLYYIGNIHSQDRSDQDFEYFSYIDSGEASSVTISGIYVNEEASSIDDSTGSHDPGAFTFLTDSQFKSEVSFAGWDFTNTWAIDPLINDGYPYLKNVPPYVEREIVTDGLVAYWHYHEGFDETGGVWENQAPATKGQYDGTIQGASLHEDGVWFDGSDDRVTFPFPSELDRKNQSFTFTFTFNGENLNTYPTFLTGVTFMSIGGWNLYHEFYRESDDVQLSNDFIYGDYGEPLSAYENRSLTFVYDKNLYTFSYYLDGVYYETLSLGFPIYLNGYTIDNYILGYDQYKGYVQAMKFYDRVLTDEEILKNATIERERIGDTGSLSFEVPDSVDMGTAEIGKGGPLLVPLPPLTVKDSRSQGGGYHITVSASPMKEINGEGLMFPVGSLKLSGTLSGTQQAGGWSLGAGHTGISHIIDDGSPVTVVRAEDGKGIGLWAYVFSGGLELTIPTDQKLTDLIHYPGGTTPYKTQLLWSIISGP
ncbi:WxL domain-containing protein (plasmid) [Pontibacillus sp. ALD_SL1]|uniref:WxL domain-containing protein n=1 Tax=Pontibacillus sp. ALD_SL1 TaxID=2777185 RepID=UPI001A956EE5|nr:WxL domain-containing protein [Pontibacillus sp. ALD_SL1]QST02512.1 WxL domain-containing protein [Pontibacillus sp. ALD_SL1]